jgi:hypothetical protein
LKIKSILLASILLIIAINVFGGYQYNRTISYILNFLIFFIGFGFSKNPIQDLLMSIRLSIPLAVYFLFLIITSFWALYPFQTLYYAFNDFMFYFQSLLFIHFARTCGIEYIYKSIKGIVIICLFATIIQLIFYPDSTRLGAGGAFLSITIPFLINDISINNRIRLLLISIVAMLLLISMSRTIIVVAVINILLVLFFLENEIKKKFTSILLFIVGFLVIITLLLIFPATSGFVLKTLVRFSGYDLNSNDSFLQVEEEDLLRISLTEQAFFLYPQYWFQGMGYMNFMQWYGTQFDLFYTSFDGNKEIVGSNLHNSFQTWALEGGVFCLIIVLLLFIVFFRRVTQLKNKCISVYCRNQYRIISFSLISFTIFGLFHQLHQSLVFFFILSIGLSKPEFNTDA